MKDTERNLAVIENFILHVTHSSEGDGDANDSISLTANELYQMARDYIEEDHGDGKGNPDDDKQEWFVAFETHRRMRLQKLHIDEKIVSYKDSFEILDNEQEAKNKFNEFKNKKHLFTAGYAKIIDSTDHV